MISLLVSCLDRGQEKYSLEKEEHVPMTIELRSKMKFTRMMRNYCAVKSSMVTKFAMENQLAQERDCMIATLTSCVQESRSYSEWALKVAGVISQNPSVALLLGRQLRPEPCHTRSPQSATALRSISWLSVSTWPPVFLPQRWANFVWFGG